MPKLKENTLLTKPGTLDLVSLSAGEDVPDWAVGLIGGQNGCLVDHAGHWQTAHQNGGPGFCVQPQNDP